MQVRYRLAVLGLAAVVTAGCGPTRLSALPIQTSGPTATPTPVGSPVAAPDRQPAPAPAVGVRRARTPVDRPPRDEGTPTEPSPVGTSTPSCWGAKRYELDLNSTEPAQVGSLCFQTGGVLRLRGTTPDLVAVEPDSFVTRANEVAVVDIRFIRQGKVTVTITRDEQTYEITVVVNA